MKTMTFDELENKSEICDGQPFKERAKDKAKAAWEFVKDNKELVIPIVSGAFMVATAIIKSGTRNERRSKECGIYDRSKGHWIESKRPIKNKEWLEIDRRHDLGEPYSSILDDMGLLR